MESNLSSLTLRMSIDDTGSSNSTSDTSTSASNSGTVVSATSPNPNSIPPAVGQSEVNPGVVDTTSLTADVTLQPPPPLLRVRVGVGALIAAAIHAGGHDDSFEIGPLPTEILLDIFGHACTSSLNFQLFPQKKLISPLFLGKVCRGWRAIVWRTPEFWTFIDLVLNREHYQTQRVLLVEWLCRSQFYHQLYPLWVRIRGSGGDEMEWNIHPPSQIFSVLADLGGRGLYYLDTFIPDDCDESLILFQRRIPNLSILSIRTPKGLICNNLDFKVRGFEYAPQLRQLSIYSFGSSNIRIILHTLQRVQLTDCYMEDLLKSLANHPTLISAELTVRSGDSGSISQGCYLPYLQELKLKTYDDDTMRNILLGLQAPQLTNLSLSLKEPSFPLPLAETAAMIARVGCLLQKLTLTDGYIHEPDLIACFAVTSLSLLEINIHSSASEMSELSLQALGAPCPCCNNTLLLPMLQKFVYEGPVQAQLEDTANAFFMNPALRSFHDSEESTDTEVAPTKDTFSRVLLNMLYFRQKLGFPNADPSSAKTSNPTITGALTANSLFESDTITSPEVPSLLVFRSASSTTTPHADSDTGPKIIEPHPPSLISFTILSKSAVEFRPAVREGFQRVRESGVDLQLEFGGISV